MSRDTSIAFGCLLASFSFLAGYPIAAGATARLSADYGQLPLHFEANRGQTHEDVRFLARGTGYGLYLTAREAVLVLPTRDRDGKRNARKVHAQPKAGAKATPLVLRMSLVGAAPKPPVSGVEEQPGKAHYFIGSDPTKWRTNVPLYAKVRYREVYPGIDLLYYGNQRELEYDFIVAPGADPDRIVLGFKGAQQLQIDAQGDLVLHTGASTVRQRKPVIYQEIDGVRKPIEGGYVPKGGHRVGFQVARYDRSRPLVIDPVLSYATYLGGSDDEFPRAIAIDRKGNAHVTGYVRSTDFPTSANAPQPAHGGGFFDAFVAKLNPTGSALVYATYLGGGAEDTGSGITVDDRGYAYVTGDTYSVDFPSTPGAFQPQHQSNGQGFFNNAFVTKLDPSGSALIYSTFLGSGGDFGMAIAVDRHGNAYVTGEAGELPTTPGAFQPQANGSDAFVTKLNATGSGLIYSTYLGGSGAETGRAIAVDRDGYAYVAGDALFSFDFPTTLGAFQPAHAGGDTEGFVTKLNRTGSALMYSTYLGGNSSDSAQAITVDDRGYAYITGFTFSESGFAITDDAYHASPGGALDVFVTKLNRWGSGLVYSTCLGGSGNDGGNSIAVDSRGNVFVLGFTTSSDFPISDSAFQHTLGGSADAFVLKLSSTGSRLSYSSYLGGTGDDIAQAIALDDRGNAYITGYTMSPDFPTTPRAFQQTPPGGFSDAFVAKIVN